MNRVTKLEGMYQIKAEAMKHFTARRADEFYYEVLQVQGQAGVCIAPAKTKVRGQVPTSRQSAQHSRPAKLEWLEQVA